MDLKRHFSEQSVMLLLILMILALEEVSAAGMGWMKVDSSGRATPAQHQVVAIILLKDIRLGTQQVVQNFTTWPC